MQTAPFALSPDRWWGDLAEVSPDLLLVVRLRDAIVLSANATFQRLLGIDPSSLVGTDQRDMVHPDDRQAAARAHLGVPRGETVEFTHRIADADGRYRWIWWLSTVGPDGVVYASGRDVTERQAAYDHAVARYDRLAEAERLGRMGSFSWVPGESTATVSLELRRIAGLEGYGDRLPLDVYFGVLAADDRPRLLAVLEHAVATGERFSIEYQLRPAGRPPRTVLGAGGAIRGGDGVVRVVGTLRDVTEQRRMEAELRRALQTQQAAVAELERLDRVKSAFLRAVSHELRTPVTVVRGMADTLRRLRDHVPPETVTRLEESLVDNAERLSELLEDLLDVDRLTTERATVTRDRFDAIAAVGAVCAGPPRRDAHCASELDHLVVDIDRVQFDRILANLLDNARKYAPGSDTAVRLSRLGERGVRLEVVDDGPGIPVEERERVFEPFHRADEVHASPGTGVGLALVAAFADAHGGRAWVEPTERGAHLVVDLPGPETEA